MSGDTPRLDPSLRAEPVAVTEIPVVDLSRFRGGGGADRKQAALALAQAFRDSGFAYLVGHGVPQALINGTFEEARRFFALPEAVKAEIAVEKSPYHRGWFGMGMENLDPGKQREGDLKEGVKIGNDLPPDHPLVRASVPYHGPNQWPSGQPSFRRQMEDYWQAMRQLAGEILHALALALELPEDHFDPWFTVPMATLGPLHYPPQAGEIRPDRLGAGAHSDFGCITLLAQDDKSGLQVRNRAGRWVGAPPVQGAFVVNVGDMLARWTNDLFASTLHRVINVSGAERYSIPFFFDPNHDAPVECIPTCLAPGEQPRYAPTTGLEHLQERFLATFEYLDDEHAGADKQ